MMFCTRCGTGPEDQHKFCWQCGAPSAPGYTRPETARLTRPREGAKFQGVCAGFARYFDVDVTLVRILWMVFSIWPLPCLGVVAYIVAWIVMPRDPITSVAAQTQMA